MLNWLLAALDLLLLLGLWGYGLLAYEKLPDRIPTHFDLQGNALAWGPRSSLLQVLLIFSGLAAFIVALSALTLRDARLTWLNVPHKDRLLRLPPAARQEALSVVWGFLWALLLAVLLVAWLITWMMARYAHGTPLPGGLVIAGWVLILAYLVLLASLLGRSLRGVLERLEDKQGRGQAPSH